MAVEQTVFEMLIECTGKAMCDSGGVYGRNWEQNKDKTLKDFQDKPDVSLEFNEAGNLECYTISVFHYLTRQLEIDELCERFNKINLVTDNWDDDRFNGVSKEAGEYLDSLNIETGNTFNSYNGDSNLSQVIQGTYITLDGTDYLVLQIHGGCDVRGGYTDAKLFKLDNDYDGCLAPEDVYGTFTPNGTDLETPCFSGEVNPEVAGVIEFSNCYDGYSLNRTDNDGVEFELNRDKGKIKVCLGVY